MEFILIIFPFRGNSGVSMRDLDKDLLPDFAKKLNYKIYLSSSLGVNVAASGNVTINGIHTKC